VERAWGAEIGEFPLTLLEPINSTRVELLIQPTTFYIGSTGSFIAFGFLKPSHSFIKKIDAEKFTRNSTGVE
jgi:hypothetical protein